MTRLLIQWGIVALLLGGGIWKAYDWAYNRGYNKCQTEMAESAKDLAKREGDLDLAIKELQGRSQPTIDRQDEQTREFDRKNEQDYGKILGQLEILKWRLQNDRDNHVPLAGFDCRSEPTDDRLRNSIDEIDRLLQGL